MPNSTEQSSSGVDDNQSTGQEIPHLLRNMKSHYHAHSSQAMDIVLSQMYPIHTLKPHRSSTYCLTN